MEKKAIVKRWFGEVFTQGNVETLKEITKKDFISHVPGHDFNGHEEFIHDFMNWFREVFHNDVWTIHDYVEDGHKFAVRYTGHMTYKGGWDSIPSSNQRVKETGLMIIYFEGGIISEMWCEMSDLDVMNQLRSTP
ncbi:MULTISPECIES: ester cyclase [Pontibacillus]|uniref:Ester cyclase n=1 Tax=Pontibacillus chungwhensis TaxID=265426 RepID=A0ABY8V032_9BACI|nr:ester cyclase [Pontibacillus chungwhensis]MCD5324402.1 ester cyclase [Pontibacillus sp. HN14]WIF99302.1 ester cyclase [Pontibacillus chungwhensis]